MVSTQHEQELAEIKAQLHDLGRSLEEVTERLDRFAEDPRQPGREATTGNGPPPLIGFVHIPKTAGGTLTSMFARAWQRGALHKAGNFMRGPEKTVNKVTKRPGAWENWNRRGGRLSVGHVPYRLFAPNLPANCMYITFLRDPVDRVLSHYYRHIHSRTAGTDRNLWRAANQRKASASSLDEAVAVLRLPEVNNLATRFLCDDPEAEELGAEALEQAKANLRRFAFVGIQERFDESVALLQLTLGLDVVPYGESRHVSVDRPAVEEISDEQRRMVEAHNELDAELYEYGRGQFETALAAAGDELASRLARLRIASASALEEDKAEVRIACEWLDHELPPGATKPRAALVAAAGEAGILNRHLKLAMRELGVKKWGGDTEEVRLRRIGGPGPENQPLREAHEWIERALPPGATKSRTSLKAEAQEAGIEIPVLRHVVAELPGIEKWRGDEGEVRFTRVATASGGATESLDGG